MVRSTAGSLWNTYGPDLQFGTAVIPTTWSFVPAQPVAGELYASQAPHQCDLHLYVDLRFSYFLFSFELKGKFLTGLNTMGRWMLMIGFGAIFGSTVVALVCSGYRPDELHLERMAPGRNSGGS
ncbi:MAG: hypothetical protein R2688_02880 [Fimbriimonadaceae bacterium]